MPLVQTLRSRGATITIVAEAENLFRLGGPIPSWTREASNRIRGFAISAAPANKRPRWAHYGEPLKRTFRSSTEMRPNSLSAFFAVGSTANYAAFVDQGTGIYNGGAAYEAKILPPWTHGGASLYEHTWVPPTRGDGGTGGKRVTSVEILGQKGQRFMDKGLKRGAAAMGMPTIEVPGENVIKTFPAEMTNFIGATPADLAFRASLEEWRLWRDKAYAKGRLLGRYGGTNSPEALRRDVARQARRTALAQKRARNKPSADKIRSNNAERARKHRAAMTKAKGGTTRKQNTTAKAFFRSGKEKKAAALAIFLKQNPQFKGKTRDIGPSLVVRLGNGRTQNIPWASIYNLL